MRPGLPASVDLYTPSPTAKIRPNNSRARAYINNVGIRRRDRNSANGAGRLVIEQRHPRGTEICRPPDTAVIETYIEDIRLAWHPASARARPARGGPISRQCISE